MTRNLTDLSQHRIINIRRDSPKHQAEMRGSLLESWSTAPLRHTRFKVTIAFLHQ